MENIPCVFKWILCHSKRKKKKKGLVLDSDWRPNEKNKRRPVNKDEEIKVKKYGKNRLG